MKEKRNLHYETLMTYPQDGGFWMIFKFGIKINSKHKTEVTITITVTQYVQQQMGTNIFSWIIEKMSKSFNKSKFWED